MPVTASYVSNDRDSTVGSTLLHCGLSAPISTGILSTGFSECRSGPRTIYIKEFDPLQAQETIISQY